MTCGSATCSPTISYSLPFPALALARPGFFAAPPRGLFHAAMNALARARTRRAGRLALMELDDRLLADIGITRAQARREAQMPFWQ